MTTAFLPTDFPAALPFQPMRISVERYHDLIAQGFFAENERFELLNGMIVEKMTKHPPHSYATKKCAALLNQMVSKAWHIISQEPITLSQSEPEPDVAIIHGTIEDYSQRHPGIGEVHLVVEVSESSLAADRYKAGIYAEAGIPVYWIVNLNERVVEVYSAPQTGKYTESRVFSTEETLPVQLLDEPIGQIPVRELLP